MANLTAEQIEQKKQQLKQLAAEAKQLKDELVEAGAWPLSDDELDEASGGFRGGWDEGSPTPPTFSDTPFL